MGVTLKKLLGEAGAGLDESNGGYSTLREVLKTLVQESWFPYTVSQGTVATGTIGFFVAQTPLRLTNFAMDVANQGESGTTTIQVQVDTNDVAELSVANDAQTGSASAELNVEIPAGSTVAIVVTAAADNAAGLIATAQFSKSSIEIEE